MLALALDAQLLDAREEMSHFTRPGDGRADLRSLQVRFASLAFAPVVQDAHRFPDRAVALEYLLFNRAYQEELSLRLQQDQLHRANLQAALEECERLQLVWRTVAETRWAFLYVPARRQALQQLRELIGDEAFY